MSDCNGSAFVARLRVGLLAFLVSVSPARADAPPLPVGVHPLHDLTGVDCDVSGLAPLGQAIGDARVVALGEVSHGSGTITDARACLTRYLVHEHGFGIIALEEGMPIMEALVRTDDLRSLFATSPGLLATEEALAFLEWAREQEGAKLAGFDVRTTRTTVQNILAFLGEHDPGWADTARRAYEGFMRRNVGPPPTTHDYGTWRTAAEAVLDRLTTHRDRYAGVADERRLDRVIQEARLVTQELAMRESGVGRGNVRDPWLARNVEWLLERHPNEKLILWAHNTHVGERYGTSSIAPPVMGELLAERLGEDYYSIAFTFGTGAYRALAGQAPDGHARRPRVVEADPPMNGTLEALLRDEGWGDVLVDFDSLRGSLRERYLEQPLAMRVVGANASDPMYEFYDLDVAFDALVYLGESRAATPVPRR